MWLGTVRKPRPCGTWMQPLMEQAQVRALCRSAELGLRTVPPPTSPQRTSLGDCPALQALGLERFHLLGVLRTPCGGGSGGRNQGVECLSHWVQSTFSPSPEAACSSQLHTSGPAAPYWPPALHTSLTMNPCRLLPPPAGTTQSVPPAALRWAITHLLCARHSAKPSHLILTCCTHNLTLHPF